MSAVAPYSISAVKPMSEKPRRIEVSAKSQKKVSVGFGVKKKEAFWKCVQNCGACCKLDKGPTFPSPEEIFDNPSDIQVHTFFFLFSSNFLISTIVCIIWSYSFLVCEYRIIQLLSHKIIVVKQKSNIRFHKVQPIKTWKDRTIIFMSRKYRTFESLY